MKFLRFENKSAALAAFAAWIIEGQFPAYIGNVAVGEVGAVHKPATDEDPDQKAIDGYWVYLSGRIEELQQYEVADPEYIAWRYAGSDEPKPAPSVCTPAQGLVALFAVKQITEDDVLAAIGQIEDPVQQYQARIGLQRATSWERGSPTMQAMAALLGLTEQDLDDLYTLAVTVVV